MDIKKILEKEIGEITEEEFWSAVLMYVDKLDDQQYHNFETMLDMISTYITMGRDSKWKHLFISH